jgi:hypothetical protein
MSTAGFIIWAGIGSLILISFILRYLKRELMAFRVFSAQAAGTRAEPVISPHRAAAVGRNDTAATQWNPLGFTVEGWQPVHKTRRGTAETVVWRIDRCPGAEGGDGADWDYAVTVDRVDRRCAECVSCTNEGIRWILEHERVAA